MKNYAVKPGRDKCHQVRFNTKGIEICKYFHSEKEALAFRLVAVDVVEKMKAALKLMETKSFKGRLSQTDSNVLSGALIDWESAGLISLKRSVEYLDSELRGSNEYQDNFNPTVSQVISAYLVNRKTKLKNPVKKGSLSRYKFWVDSKISNMVCSNVSVAMIDRELDNLQEERGLADGTINRHLVALQGAWTLMLKREGMNIENIPRKVEKRKEEYLNTPAYTQAECEIIFAAMKKEDARNWKINIMKTDNGSHGFCHLEEICRVASVTGIRRTALAELRVDEIFLDNPKNAYIWKTMKGNNKKRVPLVPSAIAILKKLIATAENGYVFHINGTVPGSAVFIRFDSIVRGLEGVRYTPKCFHSFRAHVATTMFENGKTSTQVATMLGCSEKVAMGYISRSDKGDDELKNGIEPEVQNTLPPRPKLSVVRG